MLRSVRATRYVTPLREGGSLPGLMEAADDGVYVAKFRGAGQGGAALLADLVGGLLATALGLAVPALVLLDVDPALASAEPDQEVQELLAASPGVNLGVDYLPGSLTWTPAAAAAGGLVVAPELAADIVWLDAFITNVDRTARNTNLLVWHGRLYLIDHGAALFRQHAWRTVEDAVRSAGAGFPMVADHVLLPAAGSLRDADARLAPLLQASTISAAVAKVPALWLDRPGEGPGEGGWRREALAAHLEARLAARLSAGGFVLEAEAARGDRAGR